ncbi:uncharacterized protein EKO05_0006495 [Ascochyta rabiei]|uniref:uncharacterized protein n=1 Tax=Didymella rabiei TaxID=5454 RepID=UPI001901FB08|nr:uncharacterized protein EKO05_0006495 [Ascochyta rabiei]UPX16071.1 hypothetical protein EKO05_0006495 [Ascochyta rabiei]
MNDLTASVGLRKDGHTPHPWIFRRTFRCGHPDEFIEVRRDSDSQQVHNVITFEVFQEHGQTCSDGLEYTVARCLKCARKVKEEDDGDLRVLLERNLHYYQALASSKSARRSDTPGNNGFDSVLKRYRLRGGKSFGGTPHPRILEQEHQEFRLEVQEQARSSGKAIAIPSRRIYNAPIQKGRKILLQIPRRYVSHMSEGEDKSFSQPQISTALEGNCYDEVESSLSDAISRNQKGETLSSVSVQKEGNEDKHVKDTIIRRAEFTHVKIMPTSASIHEDSAMRVIKVSPLKSELPMKSKIPTMKDFTTKNDEDLLPIRTTRTSLQNEQAYPHQFITDFTLSRRESILVEHLIDQYASPFDDASDPQLLDLRDKHLRSAPTIPSKRPLNFMHRRGDASTKTWSKSDSISKNFRKLRLDLQHSSKATEKKAKPESASPDWACRTSLAIEAGRISMDSVSMRSRDPSSSKHRPRPMRSPDKTISAERKTTRGVRLGEPRDVYSSPATRSSEYGLALSMLDRHSEGACHGAADRLRGLEGMEIALGRQASTRRDSAQVASSMDLHKRLPALPLSQGGEKEEGGL